MCHAPCAMRHVSCSETTGEVVAAAAHDEGPSHLDLAVARALRRDRGQDHTREDFLQLAPLPRRFA
eukprot:2784467-Prymnesium_polylepis.1